MAEALQNDIKLTISYRGSSYAISLPPDSTLETLKDRLHDLTSVEPALQKLLYKGKKSVSDDALLNEAGLKNGAKIQMLGSTSEELGNMRKAEHEQQRREEIMKQRAAKGPTKVCVFQWRIRMNLTHWISLSYGLPGHPRHLQPP